ncbi:MAG: hypothetical protein R3F54_25980 [Alphaproteobacteria bacterium]
MLSLLKADDQGAGDIDGVPVIVRLNARLQPLDRGDIYEDPLAEALEATGLGAVTGAGTQLAEEGGIEFCDIDLALENADEETLDRIVAALEKLGAPKGSKLLYGESEERPFGKNEGLAIYLNGTDLPDDVYQTCDINHVISEIDRLLEGVGGFQSYWEGPTETALYLYGEDAEKMRGLIAPFMASYALCQQARIEQIA